MSSIPFMQMYWADYFGAVGHLTCEQQGAYLQLLGRMWLSDGWLPNDPAKLARMASCTPARWAKIGPEVLAFFDVRGDRLTQNRVSDDLQKALEKAIIRAQSGSQGGKAKALKDKRAALANATDLPWHSLELELELERKREESNDSSLSPSSDAKPVENDFETVWKAYPHVRGRSSKVKAKAQWARLPKADRMALLPAVERYRAEGREPSEECGAPAMERWLRDRRFADFLPGAEVIDFQGAKAAMPERTVPQDIWEDVANAVRPSFADSYLTGARLDGSRLKPKTLFAFEALRREAAACTALESRGIELVNPNEITPEILAMRLQHYHDTGEWKEPWGPFPSASARQAVAS